MAVEKLLLSKWRELPSEKQQEVVDFVEFLHSRAIAHLETEPLTPASSQLGQKLRQIRSKIVMAGEPLLKSWEDVEREVADRRGGVEAGSDRDNASAPRSPLQSGGSNIRPSIAFQV